MLAGKAVEEEPLHKRLFCIFSVVFFFSAYAPLDAETAKRTPHTEASVLSWYSARAICLVRSR